ncbi:MAG: glycerophosphodiester phosphodiesterase [Thermoleophilaceae bacterium]
MPELKRVGHKGADLIAPGNTLESFGAALECGVDMIEFDVLRLRDGRLVLAHDYGDAAKRDPVTLAEGLDHFSTDAYNDVELDVDLKLPGYEREVVEGLLERGLGDRAIVSSMYLESLDRVTELGPGIRRGWSVPRVRRDYTRSVYAPVAYAAARVMRRRLPRQAEGLLLEDRIDAVMVHWLLSSRRLAERVHAGAGDVYVWTVDDADRIEQLTAIGVDGIITNDPRLFPAR